MKAVARVLDVQDGRARLACEAAAAACTACRGGRGCALRWLGRSGSPSMTVPDRQADGARLAPGDRVTLEMSEGELLRAVALAYLPPLAGLLGAPLVATRVFGAGEGAGLLAALAGLGLGWLGARAWLARVPPAFAVQPATDRHDA